MPPWKRASACPVHEIVALAPAVTGLRLYSMLNGLLRKYGVDVIEQAEITGAVVEDGRCRALVTCSNGRERSYAARSFIIATGGALGEGLPDYARKSLGTDLQSGSSACAIFPRVVPARTLSRSPAPARVRPARPSCRLQPEASGFRWLPLCSNVFFIGKTLGGYDHATEKSGNGVALATACFAARNA